jgi:hypothetical protein
LAAAIALAASAALASSAGKSGVGVFCSSGMATTQIETGSQGYLWGISPVSSREKGRYTAYQLKSFILLGFV